jgi:hypothetical protein
MSVTGEEDFLNYNAVYPLTNGYCRDTASILGANNLDLLSPLLVNTLKRGWTVGI